MIKVILKLETQVQHFVDELHHNLSIKKQRARALPRRFEFKSYG